MLWKVQLPVSRPSVCLRLWSYSFEFFESNYVKIILRSLLLGGKEALILSEEIDSQFHVEQGCGK